MSAKIKRTAKTIKALTTTAVVTSLAFSVPYLTILAAA